MAAAEGDAFLDSTSFRVSVLGATLTQSFADRLAPTGLTPKHVGLLAVTGDGAPQRDIAEHLHVAPSHVVTLVDQLDEIGAVTRTRGESDRRVQVIQLTPRGRKLLADATRIAQELDDELHAAVSRTAAGGLDMFLAEIPPA